MEEDRKISPGQAKAKVREILADLREGSDHYDSLILALRNILKRNKLTLADFDSSEEELSNLDPSNAEY